MLSGEAYTIDNSPFITQGHYYVVSVGGTTSLNGVSNWTVGDWVIAGANNQWTKLDHSQVDGTGTTGNLTKWSSTSVIADSIVSESGTAITVDGSLSTNTNLSSTGDFAVNTNKFTVAAASGNTAFTGDLAINTNKFTVNATSGNTAIAGTISVASGTISVLGGNNMTLAGPASHGGISFATNSILPATASATNDNVFDLGATTERFKDLFLGGSITAGGATFAGDVIIDDGVGRLTLDSISGANRIISTTTNFASYETMQFRAENYEFQIAATTKFSIDGSGNSTFAGNVTTPQINLNSAGGGIIDNQTGNIFIQTPSGTGWIFRNGPSGYDEKMRIDSSGNVGIGTDSPTNLLTINDPNANGSITDTIPSWWGLVIDRAYTTSSSAAMGIIGGTVATGSSGRLYLGNSDDVDSIYIDGGANQMHFGVGGSERMRIDSNGSVSFAGSTTLSNTAASIQHFSTNGYLYIYGGTGGVVIGDDSTATRMQIQDNNDIWFETAGTERMRIDNSGKILLNNSTYNFIGTNTSDGSNTQRIYIGAGNDATATQGGLISVYGNEQASTSEQGQVSLIAGRKSTGNIKFWTGEATTTERMRIDSSGNVGIGTDDPNQEDFGTSNRVLSVKAPTSGGAGSIELIGLGNSDGDEVGYVNFMSQSATNSLASIVGLRRSDDETGKLAFRTAGTTKFTIEDDNQIRYVGDFYFSTNTSNGSDDGSLNFSGGGGFGSTRGASIGLAGNEDGNGGLMQLIAGNGPTSNIRFYTSTQIERMRITSGGDVGIGTTSATEANEGIWIYEQGIYVSKRAGTGTGTHCIFENNAAVSPTTVGTIKSSGSSTSYNTSSDYRLKEDLQDFNGLDKVSKIPVYDFKWKSDENRSYGVMAHELQEVLPDAVSGEKDAEEMQGVDYSKIVPLLVKSIQELKAEVDKLKQECKCKN
jgi:hypothetical protein